MSFRETVFKKIKQEKKKNAMQDQLKLFFDEKIAQALCKEDEMKKKRSSLINKFNTIVKYCNKEKCEKELKDNVALELYQRQREAIDDSVAKMLRKKIQQSKFSSGVTYQKDSPTKPLSQIRSNLSIQSNTNMQSNNG